MGDLLVELSLLQFIKHNLLSNKYKMIAAKTTCIGISYSVNPQTRLF